MIHFLKLLCMKTRQSATAKQNDDGTYEVHDFGSKKVFSDSLGNQTNAK